MIKYTFDMDIDALWRSPSADIENSESSCSDINEELRMVGPAAVSPKIKRRHHLVRRNSYSYSFSRPSMEKTVRPEEDLVLPTGERHYNDRAWLEPDIRKIRRDFVSNGIIFPKFQEGLNSYFAKDWSNAKQCFELVLTEREDGPSMYFLEQMAEHNGIPPRDFLSYSLEKG